MHPVPKTAMATARKGACAVAGGSVVRRVPLGPLGAALPRVVVDRRLGPVSSPRLSKNRGGGGVPRGPCPRLG